MKTLQYLALHPFIFFRGMYEFRSDFGMTYDDTSCSPRSQAYDYGRDLAHRLTFRRFDG